MRIIADTWMKMPRLVRFVLRNIGIGIIIGWCFLGGLLWADVGGLFTMISNSSYGLMALFLLLGGFTVTFGPAAVATAVLMGHEFGNDDDPENASKAPVTHLEPLPLKIYAQDKK